MKWWWNSFHPSTKKSYVTNGIGLRKHLVRAFQQVWAICRRMRLQQTQMLCVCLGKRITPFSHSQIDASPSFWSSYELLFESFELLLLHTKPSWPGLLFFLNSPQNRTLPGVIVLSVSANVIRNTTYLTHLKSHLFTYSGIAGGLASCLFSLPHPWFLCQARQYTTILQKASEQDLVICSFLCSDMMARLGKESLCVVL